MKGYIKGFYESFHRSDLSNHVLDHSSSAENVPTEQDMETFKFMLI